MQHSTRRPLVTTTASAIVPYYTQVYTRVLTAELDSRICRECHLVDEQRIWAPWRIGYVSGSESEATPLEPADWRDDAEPDCFLCRAAAQYSDVLAARKQNLVVDSSERMQVLLNRYPYTNGHLLIAPLRHVALLHELDPAEHLEAMDLLGRYTQKLADTIKAEGFNVGLNLGSAAGAGVPGHLHWHLVPRWTADNNFMPTIGGIRVISQSLEAVWEALGQAP